MAKRVPLDQMAYEIDKLLAKYANDVDVDVAKVTKDFAKKGAKAISAEARSKFKGTRYASGWTSQVETNRFSTQGVIYNKTPGLPHLLEYGHANRRGGRTFDPVPGRPHIEPVKKKLEEEYIRAVEEVL